MTVAFGLIWIGAVCLVAGLALLFEANRRQVAAIAARPISKNIITGEVQEGDWWTKSHALRWSNSYYRLGAALTLIGIVLQAIGGTIATCK